MNDSAAEMEQMELAFGQMGLGADYPPYSAGGMGPPPQFGYMPPGMKPHGMPPGAHSKPPHYAPQGPVARPPRPKSVCGVMGEGALGSFQVRMLLFF